MVWVRYEVGRALFRLNDGYGFAAIGDDPTDEISSPGVTWWANSEDKHGVPLSHRDRPHETPQPSMLAKGQKDTSVRGTGPDKEWGKSEDSDSLQGNRSTLEPHVGSSLLAEGAFRF